MVGADRAAWAREVSAALESLPADERLVLKLVYVHRLPMGEASAWAGVDLRRARALVALGLQDLSARLVPWVFATDGTVPRRCQTPRAATLTP